MKKYTKKIVALLLSLVFVLSMTPALSVFAETGNLDVSKTVNWGVDKAGKTDYSKLSISITSPLPAATEEYPDILFLGCNCNYHKLTSDVVNSSLNKCLYRGNVDFFIFSNNSIKKSGSLTKGSALGDYALKSSDMGYPTHSCLSGFMDQLYKSLDLANGGANNKYEYIVMEFDSARIAADYTSNSHEAAIANALKWYYDNGRVIWITDTDNYNFYNNAPSKDYIYGSNQHQTLNSTQMKGMAAVISPSQYSSVSSSTSTLNSIPKDHKGTYTDANTVFSAIKTVIYTRLSVDIQDKIKVIAGSTIDSAEAYYADDSTITSTTKWTKSSITPTIDTATRTVSFEEEDIDVKHKWVKLNISVTDSNKFISIAEATATGSGVYDVNPNDGPASVKARALIKNGNDLVQNDYAGTATASTNCHYYDVTTKATNGTITESKKYANGETATVTYTPKAGYQLKSVTVDDTSVDIDTYPSQYKFENISAKHNVEVEFELVTSLTYDANGGDPTSVPAAEALYYSKAHNVNATTIPTRTGYIFKGWSKDSTATSATYAPGDAYKNANVDPVADTLYAVWEYGLDLDKTVDKTEAKAGDTLTFTITITNKSKNDITPYTVVDTLNDKLEFQSASYGTTTLGKTGDHIKGQELTVAGLTVPKNNGTTDGKLVITVMAKVKADLSSESSIKNKATGSDGTKTIEDTTPDIKLYPAWTVTYQYDTTKHKVPKAAILPTDTNKYSNNSTETKTAIVKKATIDTSGAEQDAVPGWEFSGWYTDDEFKNKAGATVVLSGDKTLYGYWTNKITPTKTADKETVVAGKDLTYTISVKNESAMDVSGYSIVDELSDKFTFVSCNLSANAGAEATSGLVGKSVTASNITIKAGETVTLTIKVTVSPEITTKTAADGLTNEAVIYPNTGDENITVKAEKIIPTPRSITVKYAYANKGDASDPIPYGKSVPDSVTTGLAYGDEYDLAPKQSAPGWTFDGWYYYNGDTKVDTTDKLTLDKAHVDALTSSDEVTLYGKWSYNLSIDKQVSPEEGIKGGDDIAYTITASNVSEYAVEGFKITDTLDDRLIYQGYTLKDAGGNTVSGTDETSGQNIVISGITLTAKGSVILVITAKIKPTLTADETKTQITNKVKGIPKKDLSGKGDPEIEDNSPPISVDPRAITIEYNYVGTVPAGATKPEETSTFKYTTDYTVQDKSTSTLTNNDWWTFSGWYQNEDFTGEAVSGKLALTPENFPALEEKSTIKLYGKWTPVRKYTVEKTATYNETSAAGQYIFTGSTLAYKVKVTNQNPESNAKITVVDEVPAGLIVDEASLASTGGTLSGQTITWEDVDVEAGKPVELTYTAKISATLDEVTTLANKAYVSESDGDDYDENDEGGKNKNPGTVTVYGMPTVTPGVVATWSDTWAKHEDDTLHVKLYKTVEGTETVVTDEIELTKDVSDWTDTLAKFTTDKKPITYSFKEYRPGLGEIGEVVLGPDSEYSGYATAGTYKLGYSTKELVTTISHVYQLAASDLEVHKYAVNTEGDVEDLEQGDKFKYKLTVHNKRADVGVEDVILEDLVPEGLKILESDLDLSNTNYEISIDPDNKQLLTWKIKSLAASGTETYFIPVEVVAESDAIEFTNVAKVVALGKTTITEDKDKPASDTVKTRIRNFTVSKEWYKYNVKTGAADIKVTDPSAQPEVSVTLMRQIGDGDLETVGDPITLKGDTWTYQWTKLKMFNKEGELYQYTVKELSVDGYNSTYEYSGTETYGNTSVKITNKQLPVSISYAFIAGGGPPKGMLVPDTEIIPYGDEYTAVNKPSAEGYTFEGWFTDPEGKNMFEDGTPITETTTLYGKWVPIKYNITYELDGGEVKGGTNPTTYTADDKDITLINPVREGYKFVGWRGTDLSSDTITVVIPSGSIGDRAYNAVWEPLNYNIQYDEPKDGPYDPKDPQFTEPTTETYPRYTKLIVDPNGGIWNHGGTNYTNPVEFVLTSDINVEKPTREGYVFLGWDRYILDNGSTVKLVARWAEDSIGTDEKNPDKPDGIPDIYQKKVTFKIRHGEWEDETVEDIVIVVNLLDNNGKLDPNGSATIKIPEGMKPDKGFSPENGEWDKEPTIVVSGPEPLEYEYSYKPQYVFRPVDGDEDEAVKVEVGQKLRVDPNGGKWKHNGRVHFRPTVIVVKENTKITDATRKGYKFLGWSTSVGKDGIVTLTAQWKALGAKTGDSNDMNNYLFTGMFALIAAALVMMLRKRGGMGPDGGLKLQLEGISAGLKRAEAGVENMLNEGFGKAKERARNFKKPTRTSAPKMRTAPQKMAKPEPVKIVQKEKKSYMGWYSSHEDFRIVEEEPVVEHKAEVKPELPDMIEGKEFIIKIK